MNPEHLLAHFDRMCEAPDAVPRLRRFILDLAVRGKLVEQDPRDEPASELLKSIQAEKAHLVKEGKAKKEKPFPPMAENNLPFQLPKNWSWSQLAELGFINPRNTAPDDLPASFVPMPLVSADYQVGNKHEIRSWGEIKSGYTHFAENDVALAKITPCFENGKSTVFRGLTGGIGAGTTELHVVRPIIISADYILLFLKCPHFIETGITKMTGTAGQKRVPTEYFAYSPFPLPPLAEQHRIVAKVDELMALCDRLEAAQSERESRRDRLVASSLHHLNNGADPDAFQDHARFYFNHLPHLTTRPDHIKQLRQTILNLAVRGKLVPQDPTEEPAKVLLQKTAVEKEQLIKEGKIKKEKAIPKISGDEKPFAVPKGWEWCRVWNVAKQITSGSRDWAKYYSAKGAIFVTMGNLSKGHYALRWNTIRYVNPPKDGEGSRTKLEENDLLISITGDVGNLGLVPKDFGEAYINQHTCLLRFMPECQNRFFPELMRSPWAKLQFDAPQRGIKNSFRLDDIGEMLIPLPPLAEQHRIVAKVDELMALCGQLETQLTTTQSESQKLMEAILHDALTCEIGT